MPIKPLNAHAWDMLRLIAENSTGDHFWCPNNKTEYYTDNRGAHEVFIYGGWSTGAIRTLRARGLVTHYPVPWTTWACKCTAKGWDLLAESDTEKPYRYKPNPTK